MLLIYHPQYHTALKNLYPMCHGHSHSKWGRHGWGPHHKHGGWGRWKQQFAERLFHPVNLIEFDDRYELHLVAPGRKKEDFRVTVKDDILTIHASRPEKAGEELNFQRQEFQLASFERRFQLNDKIDPEAINAAYSDGILVVTLPKRPGADAPDQEILVA